MGLCCLLLVTIHFCLTLTSNFEPNVYLNSSFCSVSGGPMFLSSFLKILFFIPHAPFLSPAVTFTWALYFIRESCCCLLSAPAVLTGISACLIA